MAYELVEIKDKRVWNKFLLAAGGHVIQSWEWGEFKATQGTLPTRLALEENGQIVASAQYTLHSLPFTNKFVGYLPKGPRLSGNQTYLKEMLTGLKTYAKKQNCVFIKLEPEIAAGNQEWLKTFKELGISESFKGVFASDTMVLDLRKSPEVLLKEMHPKWRYNIRLSQRKGIKVQVEETKEALEEFIALLKDTAKRDHFLLHSDSYYREVYQTLHPQGLAYLLTARSNHHLAGAWLLLKFGKTLYYPYGASNYEYRSYMSSHALMWEAIKLGKKLLCASFDLWGAAEENASENDPWLGFTRFKEGFGAKRISYLGTYDLVIDPLWYQLFTVADKIRWKFLK